MLPSNYAILSSRFLVFLTSCLLVASCAIDMPKETQSSFETMTVKTSDIEIPIKYSARMKGQADVAITPQVSGQLMKICVTEGQQVTKGQVLFVERNHRVVARQRGINASQRAECTSQPASGTSPC